MNCLDESYCYRGFAAATQVGTRSCKNERRYIPEVTNRDKTIRDSRAQRGDEEALNDLLARYLPRLRQWASGRLPANMRSMLDMNDSSRMRSSTRCAISTRFRSGTRDRCRRYLRRAIKNRIIDLYRRRAHRPGREELPEDAKAADPSPLELAIGAEALENYERALETLSESDREAIVLRLELGFEFQAIAQMLQNSRKS
jgi:RNA polymerase sigma-70 factor (ECF subfamily)